MKYILTTPEDEYFLTDIKSLEKRMISMMCTECAIDLFMDIPTEVMMEMSHEDMIEELMLTDCAAEWYITVEL